MMRIRSYNMPYMTVLREYHFLLTGDDNKDYETVLRLVRRMSVKQIEEVVTDFIFLQLKDIITVTEKEEDLEDE